jgi:hypothetical protein
MKQLLFSILLILWLISACNPSDNINILDYRTELGLYEPLFIDLSLEMDFNNPYDQDDIKVDALITTPNKETIVLPCFFISKNNTISDWQARYTPRIIGNYSFRIRTTGKNKETVSAQKKFSVNSSNEKGILSFDKSNAYFLKFDNGEKFRGLGLNVGWYFEPKWDTKQKYTFDMFLEAMHQNQANFLRMWICPWNFPIEWTPVENYQMLTDEFLNWNSIFAHSNGLALQKGSTPVTQADTGQLIKTTSGEESIVYKLDSIRAAKLMIYYRGEITKEAIEFLVSEDNKTFQKTGTELSESWESANGWRRIFLFSFGDIPQPANYIKFVFKSNIHKENVMLSGIQFKYGKKVSQLDCNGLSRFSEQNSEKLDSLFTQAQSKGIYMMLTLGYHGQFNPIMDSWGVNDEWQRNPYNVKNGGPCEKPADFFTNATAKKHYKNYLRYFVARWGYSPVIVSWEFWNEIDIAMRKHHIPEADIVAWHKEMSDYLNSIDPYNHIITTSLSWGDIPELWKLENIDLTQVHRYMPSDTFVELTENYIHKYNKPHIIGEYAISWKGPGNDFPYEQYEDEFHDAMWRGLFSPVAMLPLSWWWDFHYDMNHYFHFKPLATVIDEMKKETSSFSRIKLEQQQGFNLLCCTSEKLTVVWIKKRSNKTQLTFTIPISKAGKYMVRKLNTRTNEFSDMGELSTADNKLVFSSIDLEESKDIALLIRPAN